MFDNFFGNSRAAGRYLEQMISGRTAFRRRFCWMAPKAWARRRWRGALRRVLSVAAAQDRAGRSEPASTTAERPRRTGEMALPTSARTIRCCSPRIPTSSPSRRTARCGRSRFSRCGCSRSARSSGPLGASGECFLIDRLDRANEQAANSLLKTLEEPPPYLILVATAENPYDLLPTIRSRSVPIQLSRLTVSEMSAFAESRRDARSRPPRRARWRKPGRGRFARSSTCTSSAATPCRP